MYFEWKPYVPVAERRRKAERAAAKMAKKGRSLEPVVIRGRTIAATFWGKAWCDNLERYSDFANRLPRGRTYVRNGSVIDLRITAGEVMALVSGSSLYEVRAQISALAPARWKALCSDCAGAIDSLVELLQGRFSQAVMERMCQRETGLFPAPKEIRFTCSCPDWAGMCKHVAAVFYGIGARLDQNPELLFALRKVDHSALLATAGTDLKIGGKGPTASRVLDDAGLAEMFGIELAETARDEAPPIPESAAVEMSGARTGKNKASRRTSSASQNSAKARAKRQGSTAGTRLEKIRAERSNGDAAVHERAGRGRSSIAATPGRRKSKKPTARKRKAAQPGHKPRS